jgi:hypothetical protein
MLRFFLGDYLLRRSNMIIMLSIAVLILTGLCSPAQAAVGGDFPFSNVNKFKIDIISGEGEGPSGDWYSVSGGGMIIHPIDYASGVDSFGVEYKEVKVNGPFMPSAGERKELLDWLNGWTEGEGKRESATLEMLNSEGKPARTIELRGAFPTSYQPPSVTSGDNSLLEETFTFKPTMIDYASNPGREISYEQDVEGEIITGMVFQFEIDDAVIPLFSCSPGGMELVLAEGVGGDEPWDNKPGLGKGSDWVGGDEPWDNKPGLGEGSEWVGGDEPWDNKPGRGRGVNWVGGDEPWDNKPGRGGGADWVGGDEPWDNKPGKGAGSDWVGGDEPWDNKPGKGKGSDWVGGDEPWDNKPGRGQGVNWVGGYEPWDNKPGRGGGADWVGGDEPWDNKFNLMHFTVSEINFGTWKIQKVYDRSDLTLKNLFDDFQSGARRPNPSDTGKLSYFDRAGNEVRSIEFFEYFPTSYDIINVDSSSGSSVLVEVIEFTVEKCTYR